MGLQAGAALTFCSWHFDFSGIRELVATLLGCFFLIKQKEDKEALFTPTF